MGRRPDHIPTMERRHRIGAIAAIMIVASFLTAAGAAPALAQDAPSPAPSTQPAECWGCHGHPEIVNAVPGKYLPGLYVTPDALAGSVHSEFTCTTCHSALTANMHARKDAAKDSCQGCHERQAEEYLDGYHGDEGLAESEGPRPTCITCHGSHDIHPADTRDFIHRSSEQCARCHTQMGERFFGGNPFGMETHLGRTDVAACADCHGYHKVLPAENADSPVNPANILTTCRQCHTDAPPNFADVEIHVAQGALPDDPRLRWATLYMLLILVGTFGFFGYLTVLGIRHEWRKSAGPSTPAR